MNAGSVWSLVLKETETMLEGCCWFSGPCRKGRWDYRFRQAHRDRDRHSLLQSLRLDAGKDGRFYWELRRQCGEGGAGL